MGIQYQSIDAAVRAATEAELDRDVQAKAVYLSPRLIDGAEAAYVELLRQAIRSHDDDWLATQLRAKGLLRTHEERRKPNGGTTTAAVPITAADTLSQGEFNRMYARGLCVDVLAHGETEVEVYRGKAVENPRSASEALIGRRISAAQLLNDLRASQGVEPALGLPPGPNSGLTIKRV